MAAPIINNFREWFLSHPNPYATPGELLDGYSVTGNAQPATLLAHTEGHQYPIPLLLAKEDNSPEVVIMPVSYGLPGTAIRKFGLLGDIENSQLPDLIELENNMFNLSPVVLAPTNDTMEDALTNNPNVATLPPRAQGDADTEEIRSRCSVIIPHQYVANILEASTNRQLTWRWIWSNVCNAILADPVQTQAYDTFLVFVRVCLIQRTAAGGVVNEPEPRRAIPVARTDAAIKERARTQAAQYVTGLLAPQGIGAQIALLQQQVQQQTQQFVAQNAATALAATTRKTVQQKNRQRYDQLVKVCETNMEAQFGQYWQEWPDLTTDRASHYAALQAVMNSLAQERHVSAPIVTPLFVQEISTGQFHTHMFTGATTGISPFRILTTHNRTYRRRMDDNAVYEIHMAGAASASADAQDLVRQNKEFEIPRDTVAFQGVLQGFYVLLLAVFGGMSRLVQAYHTQVYQQIHGMIPALRELTQHEATELPLQKNFCRILIRIRIETNNYLGRCMNSAPGELVEAPDFRAVTNAILMNTIAFLTELTPEIQRVFDELERPRGNPTPQRGGGGGGNPGVVPPGGGGTRGERVDVSSQNPRLKNAWRALGHGSVWAADSPAMRADGQRKKIEIDEPGQGRKRICLTAALTGQCWFSCGGIHRVLTTAEEDRVARELGLTL